MRYNRRADDMKISILPVDYVKEEWVLIDRFGRPVHLVAGQPVRNWARRMAHGVLWVKCQIQDGKVILPGRLK